MTAVSPFRRIARSTIRITVTAYALICGGAYLFQERLVFFPMSEIEATPRDVGLDFQQFTIPVAGAETVTAWILPAEQPRGYVVFCHGNGGNISHRLEVSRLLLRMGMTTLLFDYRGYGSSSGKPGEQRTYEDVRAVWATATGAAGFDPARTVIWGESLGGGVASLLATEQRAAGLVLQSTFTSVPDLAADVYPLLPVRWLVRIRYPTIERLASIEEPVLVIHSTEDELIPFAHAERLFAAAGHPRELLAIRGDHNSGLFTSRATTEPGLNRFLDQHVGPDPLGYATRLRNSPALR